MSKKPTARGLPIYDSQGQACAATGIPILVFKAAKAAGCPAFSSNRVNLGEFLAWYFQRQERGESHRERKDRADADLAEIRVAEARKLLLPVESVAKVQEAFVVSFRQAILSSSMTQLEKDETLKKAQRSAAEHLGVGDRLAVGAGAGSEAAKDVGASSEDDGWGVGE